MRPGLIAAFIFNLIFVWNEFIFNFVLGGRRQMISPGLAVGLVNSGGNVDWAFVALMSTAYVILPVIFIYIFQKYLLVGMTFGTVQVKSNGHANAPFAAVVQAILIGLLLLSMVLIGQRMSLQIYQIGLLLLVASTLQPDRLRQHSAEQ
ncbi:MAG: hypothetical protein R3A10_09945 [Caldilineaceae bacterium]